MNLTFKKACLAKFRKGRKQYGGKWDAKSVDARNEAKEELLDLYNYAGLLEDKLVASVIRKFAEFFWTIV